MKHFVLVLFVFLSCQLTAAQSTTGRKSYFAVGLFSGAHSSLITYAIVTVQDGKVMGAQVLTEQRFMYEAMGYYPSLANAKKENLFYKNGIDSCFLIKNDYDKIVGYYAKPFFDLWKIRFYEHPMEFDNRGWSQGRIKPSLYQAQLLTQEYGISNVLIDYFYGDTLYKLLRNIQDPEWVMKYRFVGPDTTTTSADSTGKP